MDKTINSEMVTNKLTRAMDVGKEVMDDLASPSVTPVYLPT